MYEQFEDEVFDELAEGYDAGYDEHFYADVGFEEDQLEENEFDEFLDEVIDETLAGPSGISPLAVHAEHSDDLLESALGLGWGDAFDAPAGIVPDSLARVTVSGLGRYCGDLVSLPPGERAKIPTLARLVLRSFGLGRAPVRSIRLVGHADRDIASGPEFERKMSWERALRMRGALAAAIDRQSAVGARGRPLPPFSTRLHWNVIPAGARRLSLTHPRTDTERARNRRRNRRVEVMLLPAIASSGRSLLFTAGPTRGSFLDSIRPAIKPFCRLISSNINATNCCRAVQTASRMLDPGSGPKKQCAPFSFSGPQLVTMRDYQAPFSKHLKCCAWTSSYWKMCDSEPYRTGCAHCHDIPGPHLVLKYEPCALEKAVERTKRALDEGSSVGAGVLSGICDDKPDVGCAKKVKADACRQCPEHRLLIIAYSDDTFLFWDLSVANAIRARYHRFRLLEY